MAVLLAVGIGVVVFALWVFVLREKYVGVEEFPDSVEQVHLRRVAEARISALCAGAIRLGEKERAGGVSREGSGPAREFWRRFAAASASVERDPVTALREMRDLPGLLEEALRAAEREAVTAEDVIRREDGR